MNPPSLSHLEAASLTSVSGVVWEILLARVAPRGKQFGRHLAQQEMVDRVNAAADAETDPRFLLLAHTDAIASKGLEAATERSIA